MEKNKIKYYLYNYNELTVYIEKGKKKLEEYRNTIEVIESTYALITSSIGDGMPKAHNPLDDKILFQIEKKNKEILKIHELILNESAKTNDLIFIYNTISKAIQEFTIQEKKLVELYYFEQKRRVDTCYKMHCSISTFKRINNKVLNRLQELLKDAA